MAGKTIGKMFPLGLPGTASRSLDNVISTYPVYDSGGTALKPGDPVMFSNNGMNVKLFSSTATAGKLVGFVLRTSQAENAWGTGEEANPNYALVDVLKRGAVTVSVGAGTALRGGTVYWNYAHNYISATSVTNETTELTNCRFNTPKDASGVAEVVIITRNQ